MKINKKDLILSTLTVLISVLVIFSVVKAGSLTPPGSPAVTFKTLEDIYQRVLHGTAAGAHTLNPASGPAGTMHTTDDIYTILPTNDKICSGTNDGSATCGGTPAVVWQSPDPNQLDYYQGGPAGHNAFDYCAGLTTGGFAWRLPTLPELVAHAVGSGYLPQEYWSTTSTNSLGANYTLSFPGGGALTLHSRFTAVADQEYALCVH